MQVRDIYEAGDFLILVATDRLSAFDRILAAVPFKGQVWSTLYFCILAVPCRSLLCDCSV